MKDYKEVAKDVLRRRDEYIAAKKKINLKAGIIVSLIFSLILLVSVSGAAVYAANNEQFNSVKDVINQLELKSFNEIAQMVNAAGNNASDDALAIYGTIIKRRIESMSPNLLTAAIMDDNNSVIFRSLLLQLIPEDKEIDYGSIASLLEREDTAPELKQNVLIAVYENTSDINTLEKAARSNDESLAFTAMRFLSSEAPQKAGEIADEIINSFSGTVTDRVRGAIIAKAQQLNASSLPEERNNFIAFCDSIIRTVDDEDPTVKDTVIFALKDVKSPETISYIIYSDSIDEAAKLYSVRENYSVLENMITISPTQENLQTVIDAMEIYPIAKLAEPLKRIIAANNTEISEELAEKIFSMINYIENYGYTIENSSNSTP